MERHDLHPRRLLAEVEAGNGSSQRSLARELRIALGLTNLSLRRVMRKGWVKATNIQRNRVRYLITPAGIAEKARISSDYLASGAELSSEARDRIHHTLMGLSRKWPANSPDKRILFFGGGDVAEIGYVCRRMDLVTKRLTQPAGLPLSVPPDGGTGRAHNRGHSINRR